MRLKIAAGAVVLALAVATVFLALGIWTQEERAGSRVTVTGDIITVSPAEGWLDIDSGGEAASSGIRQLTFTNVSSEPAAVTELLRIEQIPSGPLSDWDRTLFLEIGFKIGEAPGICPLLTPVSWELGTLRLDQAIAPGESAVLCGELHYNGNLAAESGTMDLTFVFGTEPAGTP